jgi:hypothetical protein
MVRISSPTRSDVVTGLPSTTCVTRDAGAPGITPPTMAGGTLCPIVNSTMNRMAARMMFMITPAEITSIRAPTDFCG